MKQYFNNRIFFLLPTLLLLFVVCSFTELSAAGLLQDEPFLSVSEMPRFDGMDNEKFSAFVKNKVVEVFSGGKISGRVVATFVVERDGTVSGLTIIQSPNSDVSKAVGNVINSTRDWTPGSHRGTIVRVKQDLTLDF